VKRSGSVCVIWGMRRRVRVVPWGMLGGTKRVIRSSRSFWADGEEGDGASALATWKAWLRNLNLREK
jgi:hypothetical protein